MRKYLLCPSPLIVAIVLFMLVQWRGRVLVGRGEMEVGLVNYYAAFFLLVGFCMSMTWLCGCVVHDVFQWMDRRPLRRALRKAQREDNTFIPPGGTPG